MRRAGGGTAGHAPSLTGGEGSAPGAPSPLAGRTNDMEGVGRGQQKWRVLDDDGGRSRFLAGIRVSSLHFHDWERDVRVKGTDAPPIGNANSLGADLGNCWRGVFLSCSKNKVLGEDFGHSWRCLHVTLILS